MSHTLIFITRHNFKSHFDELKNKHLYNRLGTIQIQKVHRIVGLVYYTMLDYTRYTFTHLESPKIHRDIHLGTIVL